MSQLVKHHPDLHESQGNFQQGGFLRSIRFQTTGYSRPGCQTGFQFHEKSARWLSFRLVRLPPDKVEQIALERKVEQNVGVGRGKVLERICGLAQYHPVEV